MLDFCASAAGFRAQFPMTVLEYRGESNWVEGSEFFVRYRQLGIPMSWHGKVTAYEPNRYFRDVLVSRMFRYWEHTHSVEAVDGGTRYTDSVRFMLGLGNLIDRAICEPMVERFFKRRHDVLASALASAVASHQAREPE